MATGPNLANYLLFIRNVAQIPVEYLPDNDTLIGYSFDVAMAITNPLLAAIPNRAQATSWTQYEFAVYNLGVSTLLNFAQDQQGRTYFADLRERLGVSNFVPGVVASSGDQGSSDSLLNPEFMKTMTLQNLQAIKDPFGRQYLMISQAFGTLWGLT